MLQIMSWRLKVTNHNGNLIYWRNYASLGLDDLSNEVIGKCLIATLFTAIKFSAYFEGHYAWLQFWCPWTKLWRYCRLPSMADDWSPYQIFLHSQIVLTLTFKLFTGIAKHDWCEVRNTHTHKRQWRLWYINMKANKTEYVYLNVFIFDTSKQLID